MVKKVLKFGGTSVGTIERIQHVANIIQKEYLAGSQVIAVVSAMSGNTNELINLSKKISEELSNTNENKISNGIIRIVNTVLEVFF